MPTIPTAVRNLLFGTPFGQVWPPRPAPPPLAIDGRTAALRVLRKYVTNLTFYRADGLGKPPIPFQIAPENFHIEQPDYGRDLVFPSAVVIQSRARYDVVGLNSYVEEYTRDVYGQGTVLQVQAEYYELINLELWASKKAERRAMLAGLETAMSPTEQMSGLRFRMPEYYNGLVCFSLERRELMETTMSSLNRRTAQLELTMRFNILTLVNYTTLRPVIEVSTDVLPDGTAVTVGAGGTIDPDANPEAQQTDG